MKKTHSLSSLLGLSQDDLALILNISRRHFSGYESGSRNIPAASKQLLAEIVNYISTPEATLDSVAMAAQLAQKEQAVRAILTENNYQQKLTARRIAFVEARCSAKLKALQVVEFLSFREDTKDESDRAILRSIAHKTSKSLHSEGLGALFKLKLRLYMLELEKMLLDSEIRKFEQPLENTDVSNGLQMNILHLKC